MEKGKNIILERADFQTSAAALSQKGKKEDLREFNVGNQSRQKSFQFFLFFRENRRGARFFPPNSEMSG